MENDVPTEEGEKDGEEKTYGGCEDLMKWKRYCHVLLQAIKDRVWPLHDKFEWLRGRALPNTRARNNIWWGSLF